jgi:hypothetical protein
LYEAPGGDSESRRAVFQKLFPEERFKNFSPVHIDMESEIDMAALEKQDREVEKALRSKRLNKAKDMMAFICAEGVEKAAEAIVAHEHDSGVSCGEE